MMHISGPRNRIIIDLVDEKDLSHGLSSSELRSPLAPWTNFRNKIQPAQPPTQEPTRMKHLHILLTITVGIVVHGSGFIAAAEHDWNLGATGLRGKIRCEKLVTSEARQITITKVEKGGPADGVVAVGDIILGVGGKAFSYDPRTEMGKALTQAESDADQGKLSLTRSRAGSLKEVVLKQC